MARIRTIKPKFWSHEDLSALPEATHMLAAALLNYSDDYGYFNANPMLIRAECSPLREPSVSIPESLRSLQEIGYIQISNGPDGKVYGRVVAFGDHQRVSHPTPSKIQDFSIDWEISGDVPERFLKPPESFRPEGNKERNGIRKGKDSRAVASATRPDDCFDEFWKVYPKRDGANPKAPARKKYFAALKAGASSENILAATKRFAEDARSKGQIGTPYVAQAMTWLAQQRWGDYVEAEPEPELKGFHAMAGSREIDAWDLYLQRSTGKTYPRDRDGGWRFPTQWPPGFEEAA